MRMMATFRDGNLALDEGEELQFPLPDDHELASVQTLRQISSLEDVKDFQFVKAWAHGFAPLEQDGSPSGDAVTSGEPHPFTGNRPSVDEMLGLVREATGGTVIQVT